MTDATSGVKRARAGPDADHGPNKTIVLTLYGEGDGNACTIVVERNENWFPEQFDLAWNSDRTSYNLCPTEDLPAEKRLWNALCTLFLGVEVEDKYRIKDSRSDCADRTLRHQYITEKLSSNKTLDMWPRDQEAFDGCQWPTGRPRPFFVVFM